MSSSEPTVTVITVCYNDAPSLAATLRSVTSQSYDRVEYIVVDGGSTDSSVAEIQKYTGIAKWVSEKDAGIYDAMNKGLRLAHGHYVIFMNAGDEFHSTETLTTLARQLTAGPVMPLIAYGPADIITTEGRLIKTLMPLELTKANLNMFATRTVCHQSVVVARLIAGEYDTRFRLKAELDWYYRLLRVSKPHERLKLDLIISDYRLGGRGEKQWIANELERVKVTRKNNGIVTFLLSVPFFLLPLAFRLRAIVLPYRGAAASDGDAARPSNSA